VSVGVGLLVQNWGKIEEKFKVGIPTPVLDSTKELARDLKEASSEFERLGEKTRLSLPELERFKELNEEINRLEKEQAERRKTKAIEGIQGKEEAERGSAFKQAIAEAGGGMQATKDLIDALANLGMATGQQFTMGGIKEQAERLMNEAAAGGLVARDEIARAIKGFMPETRRGFAGAIEQFSPERKAVIEDIEKTRREEADALARRARRVEKEEQELERLRREGEQEAGGHAAIFGRDKALGGMIDEEGRKLVAGGVIDPARIKGQLSGRVEQALAGDKLIPRGMIPEVARMVLDKAVEKMLSELRAEGGDIQEVAAGAIKGAEAKEQGNAEKAAAAAANKAAAAGRKGAKAGADRRQRAIAQDIMARSGGEVPLPLAMEGATQYQKLVDRGADPALAAQATMAQLAQLLQRQQAQMEQAVGIMNGMGGMIGQAHQNLGGIAAQQQMLQAQMRANRVQMPWPMNTIPGL
jgi:hypothetical protein